MTSRREFVQAATLIAAAPMATAEAARAGPSSGPLEIHRAIYDERFPAARAFAVDARRRGWAVSAIRGDVTDIWFHDLALAWKSAPTPIAGLTQDNSLFCLERLAWDAGLRVVSRRDHPDDLVSWMIAPRSRAA